MKNIKLKTLILSSIVLPITISPCITSCSCNSTPSSDSSVKVTGAKVDSSKTHLEVDRDSTIYLIPNNNSKITGIKSITVGTTVLTRMGYSFEYEQTNSLAYKLTIFAKLMTSLDISIEVHTTDIDFDYVAYSGGTITTNAVLKPLSLEVVAKYKDVEGTTPLAAGEFKVFDDDTDITSKFLSEDGYKMDQAKTYNFTIKSVIDPTKTKGLSVTITEPVHKYFYDAVEYEPAKDDECMVKLDDFDPTGVEQGIPPIPSVFPVGGTTKKNVTGVAGNSYTADSPQTEVIKSIGFEKPFLIKTIEVNAFRYLKKITMFIVPLNVESIGTNAFEGCNELTKVYIDSQAIVDLTGNDSQLFTNATSVFVKDGLNEPSNESYIAQKFKKQTTVGQYTE